MSLEHRQLTALCCRCSTLGVCLSASSVCATASLTTVVADATAPVITVLLNSMSVNATTPNGQTLVVTRVYVGRSPPCEPHFPAWVCALQCATQFCIGESCLDCHTWSACQALSCCLPENKWVCISCLALALAVLQLFSSLKPYL